MIVAFVFYDPLFSMESCLKENDFSLGRIDDSYDLKGKTFLRKGRAFF